MIETLTSDKPSRIVKRMWAKAGKPGSLKTFARGWIMRTAPDAADAWHANKKAARKARPSSALTHVVLGLRRGGLL